MTNFRTLMLSAMILPALALAACDNKKEEAAPADATATEEAAPAADAVPSNAEMGIDMPQPEAVENAAPAMEAPVMEAPVMEAPAMEAPAMEAPAAEEAAPVEAPVSEEGAAQ